MKTLLYVTICLVISIQGKAQDLSKVHFNSLLMDSDVRPIYQTKSKMDFNVANQSVFFFWASWCPNCKAFMKDFLLTANKVKPCKFQSVLISEDDSTVDAEEALKEWKTSLPNYLDVKGQLRKKLQLQKIPAMVIVDSQGNTQQLFVGNRSFERGLSLLRQVSQGGHCDKK